MTPSLQSSDDDEIKPENEECPHTRADIKKYKKVNGKINELRDQQEALLKRGRIYKAAPRRPNALLSNDPVPRCLAHDYKFSLTAFW